MNMDLRCPPITGAISMRPPSFSRPPWMMTKASRTAALPLCSGCWEWPWWKWRWSLKVIFVSVAGDGESTIQTAVLYRKFCTLPRALVSGPLSMVFPTGALVPTSKLRRLLGSRRGVFMLHKSMAAGGWNPKIHHFRHFDGKNSHWSWMWRCKNGEFYPYNPPQSRLTLISDGKWHIVCM